MTPTRKNELLELGGAAALALTGGWLWGPLAAIAGGVAGFIGTHKVLTGAFAPKAPTSAVAGDAEEQILKMAARQLQDHLARVGASQNASRFVWTFQKAWNESGVGPSLNRDGIYTQDVQAALTLALRNYGLAQAVAAPAIL